MKDLILNAKPSTMRVLSGTTAVVVLAMLSPCVLAGQSAIAQQMAFSMTEQRNGKLLLKLKIPFEQHQVQSENQAGCLFLSEVGLCEVESGESAMGSVHSVQVVKTTAHVKYQFNLPPPAL